MLHLLIIILNDLDRLPELMRAWKRIGVPGATVLNSVGGYQIETWLLRIGLGGLNRLFDQGASRQRMIISLIEGEELLEQAIAEADEAVGGFDRPNSGILFNLPVGRALGLKKWGQAEPGREGQQMNHIERREAQKGITVADFVDLLRLEPVIVPVDATIQQVVEALSNHPNVHVACVVNEEKHLVGLIDTASLAKAIFVAVFPSEYLSNLEDLQASLSYADPSKVRRARDIMIEPTFVRMSDSLEEAFHQVHQCGFPGIPVVDNHYHVIGYINLLELMVAISKNNADLTADAGESP